MPQVTIAGVVPGPLLRFDAVDPTGGGPMRTTVHSGHVRLEPLISDVMPLGELRTANGMLGYEGGGQRMKIVLEHT